MSKDVSSEQKPAKKIVHEEDTFVIVFPPIKAPKWLQGFVDFIREQGVVGLSVGLILGFAAKSLVDSIVTNVMNPIVSLIGGGNGGELVSRYICLHKMGSVCTAKLGWGKVLSDVLSFMIILALVYFLIKGLKLDKIDKKKK
ncbi:MAG: MscL family protein [Candidatus Saccharimonadales bacterium]